MSRAGKKAPVVGPVVIEVKGCTPATAAASRDSRSEFGRGGARIFAGLRSTKGRGEFLLCQAARFAMMCEILKPDCTFIHLQEKPRRTPPLFDNEYSDEDSKAVEVKPEKSAIPLSSSHRIRQPTSNRETKKPSQRTVATWRRGEDHMEPSAKMLALIEQLRIAEKAGDKTIVYSQCSSPFFYHLSRIVNDDAHRDVDAGLAGDGFGAMRHPEFAVRWENAERGARCHPCHVPQDKWAQSDPDQHKMRRRWTEPHLRQPGRQVSTPQLVPPLLFYFYLSCCVLCCCVDVSYVFFSMDLSWNYAAESQAYDRVHRLGQEKDVFVKRLVVENTIEERMLRLQDVKKGARIIIYPLFLTHYLNKHAYVLSRIGRCGSRRRYRCKTQQVKCQGDQSCACSHFSAISLFLSTSVFVFLL